MNEILEDINSLYQKNKEIDIDDIDNCFHKRVDIDLNDFSELNVKIDNNSLNYHFDKKLNNSIEVYLPIKYKYIKEDLKELINYLIKYNIQFQINFDNYITVLINSLNDLNVIFNFNQLHLDKLNLFMFQKNGLGLSLHYNRFYDIELSKIILNYLRSNEYVSHKDIDLNDFKNFVYTCYKDSTNYDLSMLYDLLYSYLDSDNNIDIYYEKVIYYQNLIELVFNALIETRQKYETNECVVNAVNMMLRNKFTGITRNNNYRTRLKYFINQDILSRIIKMIVVDCEKIDNNALSLFLKEFNNYSKNYNLVNCLVRGVKLTKTDSETLITKLLETNDFHYLTRLEKSRDLVMNFVNEDTLLNMLNHEINQNYDIKEMTKYLMEKVNE